MTGREVEAIQCSCGGQPTEVTPTEAEEAAHGCGTAECCVTALACPACGTRFTVLLAAPDPDWDR